eukprot:scaffold18029_cov37-Cyclotella_meneghiniana.AAC.4
MYNQVYSAGVDSGNMALLDTPIHMDRVGNIVLPDAVDALGMQIEHTWVYPENVFVMDETGDNTNGKNQGNNGGEKVVVPKGMVPRNLTGIGDNHYTVIPVTNLLGVTVIICIIFAGEEMKASWALGIDALADNVSVDEDGVFEFGEGKVFPGGPSYFVDVWMVTVGAPYATNIWQVHDDERMNRAFKSASSKTKSDRIKSKRFAGLTADITKEEIVLVVGKSVVVSFLDVTNAQHAIAECGWNPPNRNRLLHPQILETAPEEFRNEMVERSTGSGRLVSTEVIAATLETLNHSGVTAQTIHKLATDHDNQNAGRLENNGRSRESLEETLQNARRVTSSVVFGQCDGRLGPDVFEEVKNRAVRAKEKELTKKQNKKKQEVNLLKSVRAALKQFKAKNEKIEALSNEHIKSLCQWKKGPKDKGLTDSESESGDESTDSSSSEAAADQSMPHQSNDARHQDQAEDDSSSQSSESEAPRRTRSGRITKQSYIESEEESTSDVSDDEE